MKRSTAALAAAVIIGGGFASAATSSSEVVGSTAGQNRVTVTGASMKSISYVTAAGVITGFTVQLKGPPVRVTTVGLITTTQTLFSTVSARFGTGLQRACVLGLYDAVNDRTSATCVGFAQEASRSWSLVVTVN